MKQLALDICAFGGEVTLFVAKWLTNEMHYLHGVKFPICHAACTRTCSTIKSSRILVYCYERFGSVRYS